MILIRLLIVVLAPWAILVAMGSMPRTPTGVEQAWHVLQITRAPSRFDRGRPSLPSPEGSPVVYSYPIGHPGRTLGDGFYVRHGYATENTWYLPGYWHAGEDWYALAGDTAGAGVYAIAAGTIVYAGGNYPGRVVIIEHSGGTFSMYGHLDPELLVRAGQRLARGTLIGTVLRRNDTTPNHLHFEVRTFLLTGAVNGDRPRYGFRCGMRCPPGPGYWPIKAPDHPGALGWRNPSHVIGRQAGRPGSSVGTEVVVSERPTVLTTTLWSSVPGKVGRRALQELRLRPGSRFRLMGTHVGPEDTRGTSADSYVLWYQIRLPTGKQGWVQAALPSTAETGADGRPSTIRFNFYPATPAGG